MSYTVAFLHSSPVHVETFDALLAEAGADVETFHEVREEWLERAREQGIGVELLAEVRTLLKQMAAEADIVVCTCSTLGPATESLDLPSVLRVDAPMMHRAVAIGGQVLLVLCLESTLDASRNLLERAFRDAGREPDYRIMMVPDAWPDFERGDLDAFVSTIVRWVGAGLSAEPDLSCIVLGQASMRVASRAMLGAGIPVLTSPDVAVAHIQELLDQTMRMR